MRPEIAQHLPALKELCEAHRVRSLAIFGSATSDLPGEFDPKTSDVDLLVEFLDADLGPWLKKYFAFKDACESLFGRKVDLVMAGALNEQTGRPTPFFQASVNATKVPVYVAA